jgi:hypothetical protein
MRNLALLAVAGAFACSSPATAPSASAGQTAAGEGGTDGEVGGASQGGAAQEGGAASESGAPSGSGAASDEPAPYVLEAIPILDATDVYPAPLWSGNGEEVVVEVSFSESMKPESELLFEASEQTRPGTASWSADATRLRIATRPDFTFPRPLADDTTYSLDLSALVSQSGVGLEPNVGLRAGLLVFTTGRHDALLNHSCGHTFFGPFASMAAAPTADELAPDISTTHTEYSVALPDRGGDYGGWLRANFVAPGQYRLYFGGETRVSSQDADGNTENLALLETPRACPGIAYEVTLSPQPGAELFFRLEAKESPLRRVIVELVPDEESTP